MNPHTRYGHKHLKLACLPFHHSDEESLEKQQRLLYRNNRACQALISKNLARGDGTRRIHDHQRNKRQHKHYSKDDGDAIKVLLDNAGSRLGRIHRAGNHVRNARALTGMQQDEDDEAQTGDNQQGDEDDQKRTHVLPLSLETTYASLEV